MSKWQIGEPGTEVVLDEQGRGEITFTVTNGETQQDRSVLTVLALDGAAESWFTVEEPQRAVPAGQSAIYVCKVLVPPDTAPGTYAMQARVYSADSAPDESSATSRRITMTKKAEEKKPRHIPWWVFLIGGIVLLAVIGTALWLVLKGGDDGLENTQPPTITGTPQVTMVLTATQGEWSEPLEELTVAFQWVRCDGDTCADIVGAVLPTYGVGAEDQGRTLQVEVVATNAEDDTATAVSEPTDEIAAAPIQPQSVPPVIGLTRSAAIAQLAPRFQVVILVAGQPLGLFDCDPLIESQSPAPGTTLPPGSQVTLSSRPEGQGCGLIFDPRDPPILIPPGEGPLPTFVIGGS